MNGLFWQRCEVHVPHVSHVSHGHASTETAAAGLRLEARRSRGSAGGPVAVIAPPHPLYGGTLSNPVVIGIAEGLAREGLGVLAFNWRGTDGSEGAKTDDLESAVSDYLAAVRCVLELEGGVDEPPLYAAGYSFGAAVALLAARREPRIRGLILLAPPAGMLQPSDLQAVRRPLTILVGDHDDYAPLPALQAKLTGCGAAVVDVIAGADHFFHFGGLPEIAGRVAGHIRGWL